MGFYSIEEGMKLVRAARNAIELHIRSPHFRRGMLEKELAGFGEGHGVFVTLSHYPTGSLRGCIGFPNPTAPLRRTLVDAALAASSVDPRFVPVSHEELERLLVEVSILSEPLAIKGTPEDILNGIKVGRDGLIIEYGYHSGLLLPIVAVEEEWNAEEYLENLCIKASLPIHAWRQGSARLYRFTAQVFRELSPHGPIEEILFE